MTRRVVVVQCSSSPLPKKLGIKEGSNVLLVDAPQGFDVTLGALPKSARVARVAGAQSVPGRDPFDVIVCFVRSRADLVARIERHESRLGSPGGLWIAWPKKTSKVPTDVTENVVRDVALPRGLVDNKVCAIDAIWSGLRLAWRR